MTKCLFCARAIAPHFFRSGGGGWTEHNECNIHYISNSKIHKKHYFMPLWAAYPQVEVWNSPDSESKSRDVELEESSQKFQTGKIS